MPIINSLTDRQHEIAAWRQDFHAHPEILYDVHRTAGIVADKLRAFGVDEVVTGIGQTGVVGIIHGRNGPGSRVVGLRADMDALPIREETGKPYASKTAGRMHACGHDGHTAMLLGAAQYLAETRNFTGSVVVIFQPAEEGGAGGRAMVRDGLMERWNISEVYGMHNLPGLAAGEFAMRAGPIMGSTDEFSITITGRSGHAALPHTTVDPILASANVIQALQSIVARNVDPVESAVVSVTRIQAGEALNQIPDAVRLAGTVRSLNDGIRDMVEQRLKQVVESVAGGFGTTANISYKRNYPVTVNHAEQTAFAATVATDVAGADRVDTAVAPMLGGEDFSFMLNERPGAFIFIGNGDSAGLHNSKFDFNDDIIPAGCSYWIRLAETALSA